MDAQEQRDRDVGSDDPCQWYRGLLIRKRLLAAALHFVALFVVAFVMLLAPFFALHYFVFTGDQRGDVAGSLADAAAESARWSAGYVVLGLPLHCGLQRRISRNDQQRR